MRKPCPFIGTCLLQEVSDVLSTSKGNRSKLLLLLGILLIKLNSPPEPSPQYTFGVRSLDGSTVFNFSSSLDGPVTLNFGDFLPPNIQNSLECPKYNLCPINLLSTQCLESLFGPETNGYTFEHNGINWTFINGKNDQFSWTSVQYT